MEIRYVNGDATQPVSENPVVITHIVNNLGKWGAGFVMALSRRYPQPEREYRRWYRGETGIPWGLGQVQFVEISPRLWVANMIAQHGIRSGQNGQPPIRYAALSSSLAKVADFALSHQAEVHLPRIGTGLAGGKWEHIAPLLEQELLERGIAVTIYDLP